MDNSAKFTNGSWQLPPHARGVAPPVDTTRIPAGERGCITSDGQRIVLKDPKNPAKGWALR
jgi:hypothetical protein